LPASPLREKTPGVVGTERRSASELSGVKSRRWVKRGAATDEF